MTTQKESKLKSWVLLVAGIVGIGHQQYTGQKDLVMLAIYIAMVGIPGYTEISSLLKSFITALPSSTSQQVDSEQGSISSASESSTENEEA